MPVFDSQTMRAGSNFSALNVAASLLLAAIIANHLLWVWHYAALAPVNDDYVLILNRLIMFHNLPHGLDPGFFFEFSGGQQHRLVLLSMVIVALYEIVGDIDFRTLILIGNCSLLALLWGIWKFAGSILPVTANRAVYFLPVALLVLSPSYFEASLWATGVLQNLPVLVFALFAVACAAQRSAFAFAAALFAGLLASGSSANGMAVFLACAAVLAAQRRFAYASLMAFLFVAVAWAYTRGFPSDPSNFGDPAKASLGGLIRFYLALCGAIVWGKNGAMLLGALFVAGFGVLTWRGLPGRNPVLWGFGLFLMLSMAMMSIGRSGLGLDAALLSRYKPYSGLMLAVLYLGSLILAPTLARKKIIGFSGLFIASASFVSYMLHYEAAVADFGNRPRLEMAYRGVEGRAQVLSGFPKPDFATRVIDSAEQYGIYRPSSFAELVVKPAPAPEGAAPSAQKQQDQAGRGISVSEFVDGKKATLVYGVIKGQCAPEQFRIALRNAAETLYFETQPLNHGRLNTDAKRPMQGFFGGIVDKRSLPAGSYRLGFTCGDKEPVFAGDSYRVLNNP